MLLRWRKQKPFQKLRCGHLLSAEVDAGGGFLHEVDHLSLQPLSLSEGFGVLIEITDVDGFPKFQGSGRGRSPACDEIEEGGLATAIGTNDADPVLGAEAVREVPEKRASLDLTIGGDTDTLSLDDQFPDAAAHTGHFKFPPGLKRFFVPHGFDPLQSSLLFGAASLRPLAQPGKLPAQHPFELGR